MDTIIKTLENHEARLNKHDAEIAELKKEISDLKEAIELVFKLIKDMYENGNTFEDDDLFIIADLMKN